MADDILLLLPWFLNIFLSLLLDIKKGPHWKLAFTRPWVPNSRQVSVFFFQSSGRVISSLSLRPLPQSLFTLLLGPFTFFNAQKTKYLQILTSFMRWIGKNKLMLWFFQVPFQITVMLKICFPSTLLFFFFHKVNERELILCVMIRPDSWLLNSKFNWN